MAIADYQDMKDKDTGHARPLHWGCGNVTPSGWINSDIKEGPGIDISCDILKDGLPLETDSVPYISTQHALQQLKVYDILAALRELHRVLAPNGVLRVCLPDFDKAIDAYCRGDQNYFRCWNWEVISGNFITQIMDYNYTATPLTYEFTEELLYRAGFDEVFRVTYRETRSGYAEIIDLDSRPDESFYVEAVKRGSRIVPEVASTADQVHLSWAQDPSQSLTIMWHTGSRNNPCLVEFRECGHASWHRVSGDNRRSLGQGVLHQATITGLRPGTAYEYRLSSDKGMMPAMSEIFQARTAPSSGPANFHFAFICDTGLIGRPDGLSTGTKQVIEEILADSPLFILGGGDYAYANRDRRYREVSDAIDAWFMQMQPVLSRIPFMAQYGNHEVVLEERFRDWSPRFAHPEGSHQGKNYSFDVGDVHFTALFVPETALDPDQLTWLDTDLHNARDRGMWWLVVYQHEPIYGHGRSHPARPEIRKFLAPIFERYRVDLHLSGHDQNYERTYPLIGAHGSPCLMSNALDAYQAGSGVIYAKVSPGGKLSERGEDFSRFSSEKAAFVAVRDDQAHHYALISVRAEGELIVNIYGVVGDGAPKRLVDSFRVVAVR